MTPNQKREMLCVPEIRELYLACKDDATREAAVELIDKARMWKGKKIPNDYPDGYRVNVGRWIGTTPNVQNIPKQSGKTAAMRKIAKEYKAKNPGAKVEFVTVDFANGSSVRFKKD